MPKTLNVLPRFAMPDFEYECRGYAKFSGLFDIRPTHRADGEDIIFCEFMKGVFRTFYVRLFVMPIFGGHILQIFSLRTKPKVVRVYTGPVVAGVADIQTIRNGAISDLIRDAMSVPQRASEYSDAIAFSAIGSIPNPA